MPDLHPPEWVTMTLGRELSDIARLPWGFTNETWAATSASGERFAVTRMATPAAAGFLLRNGPELSRRIALVGLASPAPVAARSDARLGVVVSRWLAGKSAMGALSEDAGAAEVGGALGNAWRRLGGVDVAGLSLNATWSEPARLSAAARRWLELQTPALGEETSAAVHEAIATVTAPPQRPRRSFVHGDLVPANLLLAAGRNVLLDLEAARIGDPLLDAAWFRWIVGYHHPELLPAAWAAFLASAGPAWTPEATGIDPARLLDALVVLRIVEILATAELTPEARGRWVVQLRHALASPMSRPVPVRGRPGR